MKIFEEVGVEMIIAQTTGIVILHNYLHETKVIDRQNIRHGVVVWFVRNVVVVVSRRRRWKRFPDRSARRALYILAGAYPCLFASSRRDF